MNSCQYNFLPPFSYPFETIVISLQQDLTRDMAIIQIRVDVTFPPSATPPIFPTFLLEKSIKLMKE